MNGVIGGNVKNCISKGGTEVKKMIKRDIEGVAEDLDLARSRERGGGGREGEDWKSLSPWPIKYIVK